MSIIHHEAKDIKGKKFIHNFLHKAFLKTSNIVHFYGLPLFVRHAKPQRVHKIRLANIIKTMLATFKGVKFSKLLFCYPLLVIS